MKIAKIAALAAALSIGFAAPAMARPDGHTKTAVKSGHHKTKKHTKKQIKKSAHKAKSHAKKHAAKKA